jgi:poly(A) polymerase
VKEALHRLDEAGFAAYVVGGSVRDFLLKRESKDHDIVTNATPDQIYELFPEAITVGKAFGVLKVPVKRLAGAVSAVGAKAEKAAFIEIATFREDLEYKDHRRPKGIRIAGPIEDGRRRDFTINALYYDPKTGCILDPTGGMEDFKAKLIRAIGDPNERFKEDALRLLRAVRFVTALDFALEPQTAAGIKSRAKLIQHVSAERVRDELTLMLTGRNPAGAIMQLSESGLLRHVLPEVEACRKIVAPQGRTPLQGLSTTRSSEQLWQQTLRTLRFLEKENPLRSPTLSWAALLHHAGKPVALQKNAGKNFNGHEMEAGRIGQSVGQRLKMSREEIDRMVSMLNDQLKFKDVFKMREATLQRFVRQPHFEELLALHKADALATNGNLAYYEFCASLLKTLKKTPADEIPKLIDGKDLIHLGFRPGPEFSEILRMVEDLALERKLKTKDDALEYVIHHFVK